MRGAVASALHMTSRSIALLFVLTCACTSPPVVETLQLGDPALPPTRAALPGYTVLAEREAPPVALFGPRLELVERPRSSPSEMVVCPFTVEAYGFPAVSADGSTIVTASAYAPGNADIDAELMELRWLGVDQRVDSIYDRSEHDACERARDQVEARVAELQDVLDRQRWRPLEPLDVYAPDAHWSAEELALDVKALAPDERPVEVYYSKGWFIARVPGVKLLDKQARLDWQQSDNEFCDKSPHISELWVDRHTRRAMVSYNYANGGCLCDENEHQSAFVISQAVIDEVDERPWERDEGGC